MRKKCVVKYNMLSEIFMVLGEEFDSRYLNAQHIVVFELIDATILNEM